MRIYKPGDRYSIFVDDIEFVVAPLSFIQKTEVLTRMAEAAATKDQTKILLANFEPIQHAIKDIKGFKNEDGSDWVPTFEDGKLSFESLEILLNMTATEQALNYVASFIHGIPNKLPNGVTLESGKKKTET